MSKYTGRFSMVIGAALLVAACGGDRNKADTALAADTSLNRDLALAGRDTAAQPSLTDVPAAGATKTPSTATKTTSTKSTSTKTSSSSSGTKTSTPTKTASGNTVTPGTGTKTGARVGTIAAGTALSLTSNSQVCTNTNKVGDKFTATLTDGVTGDNGVSIPAGATVTLTVTALKRSENVRDNIVMEFQVNSIEFAGKRYALDGSVSNVAVDRVRNQPKSADAKKVIGGAAIGAIAGQVLGKNTKSTVIGAAAGAAAGAGAAAATANYEGCVRSGGAMTVTLSAPLQVTA